MIKIEVTGASIAEVADKLLAIGTSLAAKYDAQAAAPQVAETKPLRGTTAAKARAAAVEPADDAGKAAKTAEALSAPSSSEPDTPTAETVPAPSKTLDFDRDVAPVVLNAVKVHTKEWVQEVLSEFGVARASQVPDERLPVLVAELRAGPQ
jgi:hypothetical protein